MKWKEEHIDLLDDFVEAGGDLEETHKFLKVHGDELVHLHYTIV